MGIWSPARQVRARFTWSEEVLGAIDGLPFLTTKHPSGPCKCGPDVARGAAMGHLVVSRDRLDALLRDRLSHPVPADSFIRPRWQSPVLAEIASDTQHGALRSWGRDRFCPSAPA
jgi:hypothetical protein